MSCPCCEDRDYLDDADELQPGDNHVAFTAGAVAYPNAGGPSGWDRQRHARLAKRRGAASRTVVMDLPLMDYLPTPPPAEKGPIEFRMAS